MSVRVLRVPVMVPHLCEIVLLVCVRVLPVCEGAAGVCGFIPVQRACSEGFERGRAEPTRFIVLSMKLRHEYCRFG